LLWKRVPHRDQVGIENLTPAQLALLVKHRNTPRSANPDRGHGSKASAPLHGDGTFEPTVPVQSGSLLRTVVKLRPDGMSIRVGIPTRIAASYEPRPCGRCHRVSVRALGQLHNDALPFP
jgi:hypothetical protein